MTETYDPFAGIEDEADLGPMGARDGLLASTIRGFTPLRKEFVQRPNTEEIRASVLADFVTGRHRRPLEALLLRHALEPILDGTPLALGTWARLLSVRSPCTRDTADRTFRQLEEMRLVTVNPSSDGYEIGLLREDGSGDPWVRPGSVEEDGPGFFVIPNSFWHDGLVDRLGMPGLAMFLVTLAETQDPKKPRFWMSYEDAPVWYGVSERTAERGYGELRTEKLLLIHVQKIRDDKHPAGRRERWWRALSSPYSTFDRAGLQEASKTRVNTQAATEVVAPKAAPRTPRRAAKPPVKKAAKKTPKKTATRKVARDGRG